MRHIQKRCKFCKQTYLYQTSGYGCLEPTNDKDYCTDCKAIILDALEKRVPRENRLIPSPREVEKFSEGLLHIMKKIKEEYYKKNNLPIMSTDCTLYYNTIEIYKIDGIKYYIAYDSIDDIHYFIDYEHCPFTGEYSYPYKYYEDSDSFMKGVNIIKALSVAPPFEPMPITEPLGKIYYFDPFKIKNEREQDNE